MGGWGDGGMRGEADASKFLVFERIDSFLFDSND